MDSNCRRQLQAGMREFDVKLGQTSHKGSPWLQPARRTGNADVKPSTVDPKLAWLDSIKKPDLPIRWTPELLAYLNFYKNDRRGRNIMGNWLIQQGAYEALIVSHLRKAKLPEDLLYICMIESSYNPHEYSRAGASGLWQFMPSGSGIYGLRRSRWIDERNDPVKSTKAVMMYFADLYHRFRNWHLAMGAYNQGYNGMLRSIAKYNTNDYWQLIRYENALPRDTALYVPKALAAAIIGRNRKLFGFDKLKVKAPLKWDDVVVPRSTSFATLAKAAGVTVKAIRLLNPQLRRGRTPPGIRNYTVRIPRGSGSRFSRYYDQYRSEWDRHDRYTVSHGESVKHIAAKHGMSVRKFKRLNGIKHGSRIGGGDVLLVPRLSAEAKRRNVNRAKRRSRRRARRGGPVLVAVPDKNLSVPGKRRVFYRVVKGDSLRGVARAFGVPARKLAAWNKLNLRSHLYPRMVVQAFVSPDFSLRRARIKALEADEVTLVTRGTAEHLQLAEMRNGRERMIYRATKRESFARIGKRFGLTARDLARINRKSPSTVLRRGDEIIVYRVVDANRSGRTKRQARRLNKHRARIARKKARKKAAADAKIARKRAAALAKRVAAEEAAAAKKRAAKRRRRRAADRRKKRKGDKSKKRPRDRSKARRSRGKTKPVDRQARTRSRRSRKRRKVPASTRRRGLR